MWLWASMMPGVTCLPVASMTWAPRGALRPRPISVMTPSSTRTSVFSSVPFVTVWTVPPRTRTVPRSLAGGRSSGVWAVAVPLAAAASRAVSYTHLTLPTNREV